MSHPRLYLAVYQRMISQASMMADMQALSVLVTKKAERFLALPFDHTKLILN